MKIIIATMFVFSLVGSACQNTQQPLATSSATSAESQSPAATEIPVDLPTTSTVYFNGLVLTMDDAHSGTAIWIDQGNVRQVGSDEDVLGAAGDGVAQIDLEGRVAAPGFIDSHTHRISQRFKWGFETAGQAGSEALAQGWTTLNELAVDKGMLNDFLAADAAGELGIRINCYLMVNSFEGQLLDDWWAGYQPGQQLSQHVRVAGLKIFIDFNSGRELLWEQDALNEFVRVRQQEGWQVTMKAIGQQSHELALNAYEYALGGQANSNRHRLEHSLAMNPEQLARATQMGIIVSIQPSFPGVIWHEEDIRNLTDEEGQENIFHFRDYLASGVLLVASPYNPDGVNDELVAASHVSPMGLLYRSVTQVGLGDRQPEGWMLEQNLAIDDILPMLTINGAYASGQESIIGSLTPDKLADLVILSGNPLETAADDLLGIEVLMTMVGGKVEYCADGYGSLCPRAPLEAQSTAVDAQPAADSENLALIGSLSASASLADSPPAYAVDGDPESVWNSGDYPRQWLRFEFETPRVITGVRLLTAQDPAGYTVHRIWGGDSEETVALLYEFAGNTSDGEILEIELPVPVDNIFILYVVTVESPSWVAWREVEIFGE